MKNILPYDGEVIYYGKVFSQKKSDSLYESLLKNIIWEHDQAVIFGKKHITKRKVAWYASKEYSYTYSRVTKTARLWTPELKTLKSKLKKLTSEDFNSCLLNLYHSGDEGMAWHSDGEKELKKHGAIASLSFGAERRFLFKNKKTKEKIEILLEHGSLLIMTGLTQENWLHRLPPTKKVKDPRVNLTFRIMDQKL